MPRLRSRRSETTRRLGFLLVVAATSVALVALPAVPATAHPLGNSGYTYVHYRGDCTQWTSYLTSDHTYWEARTLSRFSSSGTPCWDYAHKSASQIRVHPVHYKNGDGRGGYEVRYDWGTFRSACCYSSWYVWHGTKLSDYWGVGWYTQDQESLTYIRQIDDYRGGWAYAVWGDWF